MGTKTEIRDRVIDAVAWAAYSNASEFGTDSARVPAKIAVTVCGKLHADYGYPIPKLSALASPKTSSKKSFTSGCMDPVEDTTVGGLVNAILRSM